MSNYLIALQNDNYMQSLSFRQSVIYYRKTYNEKISNRIANIEYREFFGLEFNVEKSEISQQKGIMLYGNLNTPFYKINKKEIIRLIKKGKYMKKPRHNGYIIGVFSYDNDIHFLLNGFNSEMEYNFNLRAIRMSDNRGIETLVYGILMHHTYDGKIINKFIKENKIRGYFE